LRGSGPDEGRAALAAIRCWLETGAGRLALAWAARRAPVAAFQLGFQLFVGQRSSP